MPRGTVVNSKTHLPLGGWLVAFRLGAILETLGASRVTKKRGNPNWGKADIPTTPYTGVTSFEEVVKKLRLNPTEYERSAELREWVRRNKDQKYVPVDLLKAWDLTVKEES